MLMGLCFSTVLKCIIAVPQSDICRNRRSPRHQVNLVYAVWFGGPVAGFILLRDVC